MTASAGDRPEAVGAESAAITYWLTGASVLGVQLQCLAAFGALQD